MAKTFGNLEVVDVDGKEVYRCLKCGYVLCPTTDNYKSFALKNEAPITKAEPDYLAVKTDVFILREYYCLQCAVMFEVDMVAKEEKEIWSVKLVEGKKPQREKGRKA